MSLTIPPLFQSATTRFNGQPNQEVVSNTNDGNAINAEILRLFRKVQNVKSKVDENRAEIKKLEDRVSKLENGFAEQIKREDRLGDKIERCISTATSKRITSKQVEQIKNLRRENAFNEFLFFLNEKQQHRIQRIFSITGLERNVLIINFLLGMIPGLFGGMVYAEHVNKVMYADGRNGGKLIKWIIKGHYVDLDYGIERWEPSREYSRWEGEFTNQIFIRNILGGVILGAIIEGGVCYLIMVGNHIDRIIRMEYTDDWKEAHKDSLVVPNAMNNFLQEDLFLKYFYPLNIESLKGNRMRATLIAKRLSSLCDQIRPFSSVGIITDIVVNRYFPNLQNQKNVFLDFAQIIFEFLGDQRNLLSSESTRNADKIWERIHRDLKWVRQIKAEV